MVTRKSLFRPFDIHSVHFVFPNRFRQKSQLHFHRPNSGLKTQSLACQPQSSYRMRKLKEQGYQDMLPSVLDLESQDYGVISHRSAGNRLGFSRKFDETDNLLKHAEVCAETKWCKEVHNQSTVDPGLPELVAFLQDTSASGERHPSHGKCGVQGCELDHNAISCTLDSDVDSGSEATRHALWTETSYVVKFKAKQVLHKDQEEIRSPEQVAIEKKVDVHVKDEILVKHVSPEMPPIHGHVRTCWLLIVFRNIHLPLDMSTLKKHKLGRIP